MGRNRPAGPLKCIANGPGVLRVLGTTPPPVGAGGGGAHVGGVSSSHLRGSRSCAGGSPWLELGLGLGSGLGSGLGLGLGLG
eukprot:scaffold11713_cov65-Phaeocystis_antarctica.AAC.1